METTFAALGVAPGLVDALKQDGIETPFAIQTLTLPDAIAGLDICGKAKTGSGKTLAFGLPLLGRVSKAMGQPSLHCACSARVRGWPLGDCGLRRNGI